MKFIKTELPTGKAFISECGEYKVVNYGEKIHLFHKIFTFYRLNGKKKKYRAFGDSCFCENNGSSKTFASYRKAFKMAEIYKNKLGGE